MNIIKSLFAFLVMLVATPHRVARAGFALGNHAGGFLKGLKRGQSSFHAFEFDCLFYCSFIKILWHANPELNIQGPITVINRGNYRSWIFESSGARNSFLKCLQQTCHSMQWRLHAWCLMGNHYHLCIQTPQPNLVRRHEMVAKHLC